MLYVVRHAMPAATRETPPGSWPLTSDGAAATERLMAALPSAARFVASAERKAWETIPGTNANRDPRLNEIGRGDETWSDDFRERRRAWVEGLAHKGWEAQSAAAARFQAAVADAVSASQARGDGGDVVIASHGMAITNWLVSIGALDPASAGEFWDRLTFPDCWLVDDRRLLGRLATGLPEVAT